MTDYTDFVRDFPSRCTEILKLFYGQAKQNNREATLLIMAATAAFIIPYERLLLTATAHPANDRERFPERAKCLDTELGRTFLQSSLKNKDDCSWSVGRQPRLQPIRLAAIPKDTPTGEVLATLRNALAHGNLWTMPGSSAEIESFIFWSRIRSQPGYKYVHVSPLDLYNFLINWSAFLKTQKIPASVVRETFARAA